MISKADDFFLNQNLPLYFPHREAMQSGDLLQWRSETPIGGAIRFFRGLKVWIGQVCTKCQWSWPKIDENHSSWVIKGPYKEEAERRWHCESVNKGLVPRLLSERLLEHKGTVYWYALLQRHDNKRDCINRWAYNHLILGYDFLSVFRQIYRSVKIGLSRVFCSEAVCAVMLICGLTKNKKALPPDKVRTLNLWQQKGVRIK